MNKAFALSDKQAVPDLSWPHAPPHQLAEGGTFFVTAGTYRKEHHFRQRARLDVLHRGLLKVACDYGWQLEAWAVFSNHYHFVAYPNSGIEAGTLSDMLSILHSRTAGWVNSLDRAPGRQVWHNFRETRLTYTRSYLARLHYVHANAVKHNLVAVANQYPWCSAAWFERTALPSMVASVYRFKIDQIRVPEIEPCLPK